VGPRAGLNGRKISSPPGFDPEPSSPQSVAIPTELPGPHYLNMDSLNQYKRKMDVTSGVQTTSINNIGIFSSWYSQC